MLKLANTVLILINPSPSNVKGKPRYGRTRLVLKWENVDVKIMNLNLLTIRLMLNFCKLLPLTYYIHDGFINEYLFGFLKRELTNMANINKY